MIDWLTLLCPRDQLSPVAVEALSRHGSRLIKVDPDGAIEWAMPVRQCIRSDSHQVSLLLGARDLEIAGSPARVMQANNVFGSGDIVACWQAMRRHVERVLKCGLPRSVESWRVSRCDVTHNYLMQSRSDVQAALTILRNAQGGRLQVRAQSESVYWSPRSRWRSGKAYAKGPHLELQIRKGQAQASEDQCEAASRILRLELALRGHWWRRNPREWWTFTEGDLDREHTEFFAELIGGEGVIEVNELEQRCIAAAGSEASGRAVFKTWCLMREVGPDRARLVMNARTWRHHVRILKAAGLSLADMQVRNVMQLRRLWVLREPVRSWEECRRAA